ARTARGGVRLVLSAALLACLHLATAPRGRQCGPALSGDVLSLQAVQPVLAFPDPLPAHGSRLEAACGNHAPPASAISQGSRTARASPACRQPRLRGCMIVRVCL